ncbi:MAG: DUF2155 domain-containing protein [Alphaproteobacteria bacterium]|nr:DUF2155 domain-containing protein [Alphaproteobacteria bacterium]
MTVCRSPLILLAALVPLAADPAAAATWMEMDWVVLRGLEKTTARISLIEGPVQRGFAFGTLAITVRACRKRPPEEPPENAAFLEIMDGRPDQVPVAVFSGWMMSSSPALSAMEHPVYDIWVLECRKASSSERDKSGRKSASVATAAASSAR